MGLQSPLGGLHCVPLGVLCRDRGLNASLFLGRSNSPSVLNVALHYQPILWHIVFPV